MMRGTTDPDAAVGGVNAGFSILLGYVISRQSIGTSVSLAVPSLAPFYFQLLFVHLKAASCASEVRAQLTSGLIPQRPILT